MKKGQTLEEEETRSDQLGNAGSLTLRRVNDCVEARGGGKTNDET